MGAFVVDPDHSFFLTGAPPPLCFRSTSWWRVQLVVGVVRACVRCCVFISQLLLMVVLLRRGAAAQCGR